MTFGARYINNIIQFAGQQGANKKSLIAITGLSETDLCREDLRLDVAIYNTVLETALTQTQDKYLGLHIGEYLNLSAAGLILQLSQSSETIRQAIDLIIQFANLGCQALPFSLNENQIDFELQITPNELWVNQSPESVRHTIDAILVFTIRELHTLTHQKYYPTKIQLSYAKPKYFMEYERLFKCPIEFNQPVTKLFFEQKLLAEKVITSDYNLLRILVQFAEQKLQKLTQETGFSTVVEQTILNLIKPEFPTINTVAANLNLSVRTLQRKLKTESKTYKSILDDLKHKFALDYIKNPNLSISEIAYLLDYSEVAAFSRSFKRWTGKSPLAAKREI
jgi:AraC-like DNA-binding protein